MLRRRWWAALISILAGTAFAAGCSSDDTTFVVGESPTPGGAEATTSTRPDVSTSGTLRITQVQTACCYTEGQVSYLTITGPTGPVIADRSYQPIENASVLYSAPVPAGRYDVVSYQRPCDGNCSRLDSATDRCTGSFDVTPGETSAVVIRFAPGKGCDTQLDATVTSKLPDEIALLGDVRNCGVDYQIEATGRTSAERACLVDAYKTHVAAQVITYNHGSDTGNGNDQQVVRVDTNSKITVYRRILGPGRTESPWTKQTCTSLSPDKSAGYKLAGCTAFEAMPA